MIEFWGCRRAGACGSIPPQISMDVEFAQLSDLGRVRQGNEDYLGHAAPATPERVRSHGWLFVLGRRRGRPRSRRSGFAHGCRKHDRGLSRCARRRHRTALCSGAWSRQPTAVIDAGHASESARNFMATTIVACALRYDRAAIAHVGDSRCYLIRRGQATPSHPRPHRGQRACEAGPAFRRGSGRNRRTRHVLSRCLGGEFIVGAEINEHQVFAGDVLLLCSDGLQARSPARKWPPLPATARIWPVRHSGWSILPISETAVIISACS